MRLTKDLLAGLMFCLFGIGAVAIARDYNLGTLHRMGSGFFPVMVGSLIGLLGVGIAIRAALWPETSEPVGAIEFRPVLMVAAAIIVFGLVIGSYGLVAALAALILVARLAGREGGPVELAMMILVLTGVAVGIFVYALRLRLPLWPF